MSVPVPYTAASIVVVAVVAVLVFLSGRRRTANRLTPLAGLAFAFVVAGIVFGADRATGYGLLGVGVALSIVDVVNRSKRS